MEKEMGQNLKNPAFLGSMCLMSIFLPDSRLGFAWVKQCLDLPNGLDGDESHGIPIRKKHTSKKQPVITLGKCVCHKNLLYMANVKTK